MKFLGYTQKTNLLFNALKMRKTATTRDLTIIIAVRVGFNPRRYPGYTLIALEQPTSCGHTNPLSLFRR